MLSFINIYDMSPFIYSLQKHQLDVVDKNKKLQKKLEEILPESIKDYEGKSSELKISTSWFY